MDAKELIGVIRADISSVKEQGLAAIPIQNLLTYLVELEKNAAGARQAILPEDLEEYKARLALANTAS